LHCLDSNPNPDAYCAGMLTIRTSWSYNNNNNVMLDIVYGAVIMAKPLWVSISFMFATLLFIFGPSHLTWTLSLPVGCYCLHPPSPFIIITLLLLSVQTLILILKSHTE